MRFEPVRIITNGNMAADVNSLGIDMNQQAMASIQAVFTGAPEGTLTLQISNDIIPGNPADSNRAAKVVNWSDYTGSPVLVSTNGNFTWNLTLAGYQWLRLIWIPTSGTGVLNATFSGKG